MRYTILLAFIIILSFGACTKPDEPEYCTGPYLKAAIDIAFKGYTKDELDTIITERYIRGSNFMQLVDTAMVIDSNVVILNDTMLRAQPVTPNTGYRGFATLKNGFDYQIVVPSTGRRYRITDITFPVDSTYTYVRGRHGCTHTSFPEYKHADSIAVDNQPVQPWNSFKYPCCLPFPYTSLLYLNR